MSDIKRYLPSFGRKHGRTLKKDKKDVLEHLLPTLLISPDNVNDLPSPIQIEIGYGSGEHLCHRAALQPDVTFIGCEVYEHGIATCLKNIKQRELNNIRLFTDDARILLESIAKNSVDKLYLLFPDPWPKKKHHKRRIVNQQMLTLIQNILKNGGELAIATDHHEYAQWIMVHIDYHGGYEWTANNKSDWRDYPKDHIVTRYQDKNKAETDYPVFLNYKKI